MDKLGLSAAELRKPSGSRPLEARGTQKQILDNIRLTEWFKEVYTEAILSSNSAPAIVEKQLEGIREFSKIKSPSLEEHRPLIKDLIYARFVLGFNAEEFFGYGLEGKTVKEWAQFYSVGEGVRFYDAIGETGDMHRFGDKYLTYKLFKPFYKRDIISWSKGQDTDELLEFLKTHDKVIVKDPHSSRGYGVAVYDMAGWDDEARKRVLDELMERSTLMCEEFINQHEALACFHPQSVNTIRMYTYFDGVTVTPFAPCLRMGAGSSDIDSMEQGGVSVDLDVATGTMTRPAIDTHGNTYETHPTTGVKFVGTQLPYWSDLLGMLDEMAPLVPGIPLAAWDFALTKDKGWVMIEGNERGQLWFTQMRTHEPMRKQIMSVVGARRLDRAPVKKVGKPLITDVNLKVTRWIYGEQRPGSLNRLMATVDGRDIRLSKNTDYRVVYHDATGATVKLPEEIGDYIAVITGMGKYEGRVVKALSVVPAPVDRFNCEVSADGVTVSWESTPQLEHSDFVEIRYSKFKSFETTFTLRYRVGRGQCELENVQPGTEYFVMMRSLKDVNGERVGSRWSSMKSVTTL